MRERGEREREREGRRETAASGPTGNSPSEIWRGAIDFRSGNDQYVGRRGVAQSERGWGRKRERRGGKSIHCFEETRRARVPAHRPANGASFGGSMRHCVLPRRLRSLCFRLSFSFLSPLSLTLACVYIISPSSLLYTLCISLNISTHALVDRIVCSREMIHGGRITFTANRLDVNTRGISGKGSSKGKEDVP